MEKLKTQGIAIPRRGLGTFRLRGDNCRSAIESALELGYRHIDTAEMYDNEAEIGDGIAAAGIPRDELHVTTKVWLDNLAPQAIRRALDASLRKLKLDCLDLYLVHWPAPNMDMPAIFGTFAELKAEGRIRAMGVCNFAMPLLRRAVEEIGAPIACNQIEYHFMLDQTPMREYLAGKSMGLVAYCPLAQGAVTENRTLIDIGKKHEASSAQVALKWLLDQDGVIAIPKASRRQSQQANLDALKLKLDDDDRRAIAALPKNRRLVNPDFAPKWDEAVN